MAVITESPRTMLMTPLATSLIGFVPEDDTGWPEVEVSQPSKGTAQPPPAACTDEAGSTQDAASSTDGDAGSVSSAIEGDWLLCSGPPLGLRTDHAGIRFDPNARYESLVWDGTGTLAASIDLFDSGRYEVGPDHGAGLEGLVIRYGFYDAYGVDIDRTQLPDRLTLLNSGGTVRRSLTGE